MADTRNRLGKIDQLEMPDEWASIRVRAPRSSLELDDDRGRVRSRSRRPAVTATVFLATIALLGAALFGLSGLGREKVVTTSSGEVVFFPKWKEPSNIHMAALAQGTLVEERGCVFLEADPRWGNELMLVIWPNQATLERGEDGLLEILFDGHPYGKVGDHIQLGGGALSERKGDVGYVEQVIGATIPERCLADTYWSAAPPGF